MNVYLNKSIAMLLVLAVLVSCTIPSSGPGYASSGALVSAAAKAMSGRGVMDEVSKALADAYGNDLLWQEALAEISAGNAHGVAEKTLDEGSGKYLEFCVAASEAESIDEILEAASGLAPESELDKVRAAAAEMEADAKVMFAENAKILTPEQKEDFYNDLTDLVITSAVLLTAAIVYWAVPDVILWGKITAAAAVAVVAGVAAGMLMAVVKHFEMDQDAGESFMDWMETIATEVSADWALAAAIISLGTTIGREPVVTSIVLGLFWLFGVADEAADLIEKYEPIGGDGGESGE